MNICYSLFDYTGLISIASLFKVEKSKTSSIHLYVLHDERISSLLLPLKNIVSQYQAELTLLDVHSINNFCQNHGIPSWKGHYLTYARLYLPDLCPNINRMIYVDSDTLILKNLDDLWSFDLKGKAVGAVHEISYFSRAYKGIKVKPGTSETMNAGVLLMDLDRLRDLNLTGKFGEVGKSMLTAGETDQDFLNQFLTGDVAYVLPVFNAYALFRFFPIGPIKKPLSN